MFTISWHFKPHKVTLWHWCMASATQSFEKAHAILSFRCAPAYAISTWKNIANKTDASPGVFLQGNQIWIHSMASALPSAMAALCAMSNKGSIWDNDGCAVHGEVPSLQHMGCPGLCGVLLTWGTRGPGESCTSCSWKAWNSSSLNAASWPSCASRARGWIRSVRLLYSLQSPLFLFKYFQSSHPHWLFGT